MAKAVRTFIAVEVSPGPGLRDVLRELGRFGPAVRPVSANDLYVTVKFLGETMAEQIAPLSSAVETAVRGHLASRHELRGLGAFPHVQRPSVVWSGATEPESLIALAGRIEECCAAQGFPVEPRPFHPHLTLARVKARPPESLAALILGGEARLFGTLEVRRLTLFQSDLQSSGPRYTPLTHWSLENELVE
jgi:2'-5' RNA ligase